MLIWQRKLLDSCLKVGTMTCERTQHCPHNSLTMRAVLLGYARKLHFFFHFLALVRNAVIISFYHWLTLQKTFV